MREQGKKKVQRSMVADNESGRSVMSAVRTSSGMFLDKRQVLDFYAVSLQVSQKINSNFDFGQK